MASLPRRWTSSRFIEARRAPHQMSPPRCLGKGEHVFETVLRHPLKVLSHVARDPADAVAAAYEGLAARFESGAATRYEANPNWEPQLWRLLDIPPIYAEEEFWPRWYRTVEALRAQGLKVGPFSFHGWNDGDAGFVRAIWSLVRHLRPDIIVETGVAHGMTSRFILEALTLNGAGNLWSIDLPPLNPRSRREVGIAVDDSQLRDRWSYIAGTSRRRLPALLAQLRRLDIFIHDSMHSERNVAFELGLAWKYLRPGGVIIVDDIDANPAFQKFCESHTNHAAFVCTAEPLGPDARRSNQKGMFGILCKSGMTE